jgi:hypothetical protein
MWRILSAAVSAGWLLTSAALAQQPIATPPAPAMDAQVGVLLAVVFVVLAFFGTGFVILKTEMSPDVEIVKLRFAQVMFVGIITLFIFTAILYMFSDGRGKEIFDKAITAMTPLAGVIIGYLFGSKTDVTKT